MKKTKKTEKPSFEASLKTLETENVFDRTLYRPIGYRIALLLQNTGITPNAVTIISIFVGVGAGVCFYPENIWINIVGIFLLFFANVLDCVDGQLARITGIKSPVGRILDGLAGDFWFISIYSFLALRLTPQLGATTAWMLAAAAGVSNLIQANIVDYYKTLHLYFISLQKGAEFHTVKQVREEYEAMNKGISKLLYKLYLWYTVLQTNITPRLQQLLDKLLLKYGEDFPEEQRTVLRAKSLKMMPLINLMTFNWRSVVLFVSLLSGYVWFYLLWEIVALNIVLIVAVKRHERQCADFQNQSLT
jgi:phosphatidylglycerophosphate synthase